MARFICAVHAEKDRPVALALVEQAPGPDGPTYHVRGLRPLGTEDPRREIADALADEPQLVGQSVIVTTGGQPAAAWLHAGGASAVPVALAGPRGEGGGAVRVSEQVLVNTFELLYREGAVEVPGPIEAGSAAVTALYRGADLEAAAPDSVYSEEGDVELAATSGENAAGPASEGAVAQSGGQAGLSTAVVTVREHAEMLGAGLERPRRARIAPATEAPPPDLGEARGVALALALACWYGEYVADELPVTDQAGRALRRQAARGRSTRV